MQLLRKYFPLAIGLTILVIIGLLSPWADISRLIGRMDLGFLYILAALSITYYLSKAFRFWYILRRLNVRIPIGKCILVYLAAQPVSILPAGELYRSVLLQKYFKVKISKTAPAITLQGLVEAIILLSFSLIGAFILGNSRVAVVLIAIALAMLVIALQRGWLLGKDGWVNKLPFISIGKDKYEEFLKGHQVLLQPVTLSLLAILSLIPVICGVLILFFSARSIDSELAIVESAIGYSLPVVLSGLSLLPGGVGVGEGGTIGLLYVFGITAAAAITITLLMRMFTLIAGMIYGFIAQVVVHFILEKR